MVAVGQYKRLSFLDWSIGIEESTFGGWFSILILFLSSGVIKNQNRPITNLLNKLVISTIKQDKILKMFNCFLVYIRSNPSRVKNSSVNSSTFCQTKSWSFGTLWFNQDYVLAFLLSSVIIPDKRKETVVCKAINESNLSCNKNCNMIEVSVSRPCHFFIKCYLTYIQEVEMVPEHISANGK